MLTKDSVIQRDKEYKYYYRFARTLLSIQTGNAVTGKTAKDHF